MGLQFFHIDGPENNNYGSSNQCISVYRVMVSFFADGQLEGRGAIGVSTEVVQGVFKADA